MGYSFRLAAMFFYMLQPTYRIVHNTAFGTPVVEHWLEREIARLAPGMSEVLYLFIIYNCTLCDQNDKHP